MSMQLRHLRSSCCLLFLLLCGEVSLHAETTEEEVSRLEDAIIENRLGVTRWQARVRATNGGKQGKDRPVGVDTYADGTRMRMDVHWRYDEGVQRPDPDQYTYRELESYSDSHYYEYSSRGKVGRYGTGMVVRMRHDLRGEPTREEFLSYDPRAIGNAPVPSLSVTYSVPGIFRLPGRVSITVEDDVLSDGTKCKKVTSRYADGMGVVTYWVSVAEGHSIRRFDGAGEEGTPMAGLRVHKEIAVAQWKNSGIWLPKSTHHERYEDDELVLTEDAEIEWVSVNEPLDPDLFEPISFGISPGQNVYYQPRRNFQRHIWDGEQIVSVSPELGSAVTGMHEDDRTGVINSTTLLLVNAGLFVFIAVVFLVKAMRSKASQAPPSGNGS